jgi:hypothetical protein
MALGIDASISCLAVVKDLKGTGIEFVARYYANAGEKALSKAEAVALSSAGLKIVAIWEDGFPTKGSYFSYAKGVDDGTSAFHDAMSLGQPIRSPIYFAVDYDAELTEICGCIADYFAGVRAGFAAIAAGNTVHPVGVYASGATCSWLLAREFVSYTWLSQSLGFRGSKEFTTWNLKQGATEQRCGIEVDTDEGDSDYGGFMVPM